MKLSKISSLFAITLALSSSAFAAVEGQWEIWTGSLADFTIQNAQPGGEAIKTLNLFTGPTSLRPSIGYVLGMYNLEAKLSPSYSLADSGTANDSARANYRVLLGLNYSFMGDTLYNSYFVEAQAGVNRTSTFSGVGQSNTATKFAWSAGFGKRFNLFGSLNWAPQVSVTGIGAETATANAKMFYSIIPVQFTFFM